MCFRSHRVECSSLITRWRLNSIRAFFWFSLCTAYGGLRHGKNDSEKRNLGEHQNGTISNGYKEGLKQATEKLA